LQIIDKIKKDNNLNKSKKNILALIVTPTRELAIQIDESFSEY
jgi:superfamily II DNA/RNA helicase